MKRLLPPVLFFFCLALMIAIHLVWPIEPTIPAPSTIAFVIGLLATLLLYILAL